MNWEVSRDVISDLWPLYRSGEASRDTRSLVDAFLSDDGGFATTLRESEAALPFPKSIRLSPDAELRLLEQAQQRARHRLLIIAGAVGIGGTLLLASLGALLLVVARGLL